MKPEKVKTIKENLVDIYDELNKIDFEKFDQTCLAIQILSKIIQANYYMDKLIKEIESEDNIGNKQD